MADNSPLKPLTREQAHASQPHTHVWLRASAGTGKTAVLSARVLRLLLNDVPPERILCLTFTKAGAAEMAERVHSRLASWVQIDDKALFRDLEALGEDSGPEARERARLLFARVLDATGGGLRIQTIHSFCQALLAAFPLEAGLVPGFRPLDDRGQAELSRQALIEAIEGGNPAVLAAIEMLALRLGEEATQAYLASCTMLPARLEQLRIELGESSAILFEDLQDLMLGLLDLPLGDIDEELVRRCHDDHFPLAALKRVSSANAGWATKSGLRCAEVIGQWLEGTAEARVAQLETLLSVLLTQKGEVKGRDTAKLLALEPDYVSLAGECGEAAKAMLDLRRQVAFARLAGQALTAGRAYAEAYALAKHRAGAVDFDDLIGHASALLTRPGMADWIRFKLDQRVDHILVDEAQDTNDAQWSIVDAVVQEFFEAEPDPEILAKLRTLFVVGDTKQAIFGFQGTSPEAFVNAFRHFHDKAVRVEQPFAALPLAMSFRSMPAVLDVVDAVLAEIGHENLGLEAVPEPHVSARQHPGGVMLLPATSLVPVSSDGEGGEGAGRSDEEPDGDEDDWHEDHQRVHATKIANLIKRWLDDGEWLHTQGRPMRPGDILILLRSRSALSRLIVGRLYDAGVPVAGVDRLRLQAPLAVQDLLAALRFAVQPDDDLNLASLLVSPIVGWTQEELLDRAVPRDGSLWSHLRATLPPEAQAPLRSLLAAADFTTPYRYLEDILSGPMDGRRKLVARLGPEARDAIDELLNAALGFEADDHPSLQRFIDWFDRGDADIKRELGDNGDMVRVMTVHGSKGLEAPVVILADAAFDPKMMRRTSKLDLRLMSDIALPIIPPKKDEMAARVEQSRARWEALELQEHWRLLYVALTRAEERLIVTGALGSRAKGEVPEQSWFQMVDRALRVMEAGTADVEGWGVAKRWLGPEGLPSLQPDKKTAVTKSAPAGALPSWLHAPAPEEARPPRPLAPSAAIEDDVPNPPPDAALRQAAARGKLLHSLFERLPDLAPADRRAAAERWLAGVGGIDEASARGALIDHAMAVLDHPEHRLLFGPDALAEAPIAAVVDGQVIAGTIDRLLVTDQIIELVDFKTGRRIPSGVADVPLAHVRQMAAYAAALAVIFPGRPIRVGLLYTSGPTFIELPEDLLAAHKP